MNRFAVVVVWLTLSAVALVTLAQDDSEAVAIAAECSKLHNVDAEDADVALQANENITEDILVRDFAFTCYSRCTLQKMGLVDADGNIDDKATIDKFEIDDKPAFYKELIQELLKECKVSTPDPQSCGHPYGTFSCMLSKVQERVQQ